MVVLVVSMLRLLEEFHWVMVPLLRTMVRAGVVMGGGDGGDGAADDVTVSVLLVMLMVRMLQW